MAIEVPDFTLTDTVLLSLVAAAGIGFFTWLVAGYYERRGGLGKK